MTFITLGNKNDTATDPSDHFNQRIFTIVNAIPRGKVATYGQIARLAGHHRAARQVGRILHYLPTDSILPWHRVVNRFGKISLIGQGYQRQRAILEQEKIIFTPQGIIDLARFGWQPENKDILITPPYGQCTTQSARIDSPHYFARTLWSSQGLEFNINYPLANLLNLLHLDKTEEGIEDKAKTSGLS